MVEVSLSLRYGLVREIYSFEQSMRDDDDNLNRLVRRFAHMILCIQENCWSPKGSINLRVF